MFIETSCNSNEESVFVPFERTDIIYIRNITLYYNSFSNLTSPDHKSMGRFRIQILLEDNTWSTRYIVYLNMIDIVIHQLIGL